MSHFVLLPSRGNSAGKQGDFSRKVSRRGKGRKLARGRPSVRAQPPNELRAPPARGRRRRGRLCRPLPGRPQGAGSAARCTRYATGRGAARSRSTQAPSHVRQGQERHKWALRLRPCALPPTLTATPVPPRYPGLASGQRLIGLVCIEQEEGGEKHAALVRCRQAEKQCRDFKLNCPALALPHRCAAYTHEKHGHRWCGRGASRRHD